MFLRQNWGTAYENTDMYKSFFFRLAYPFNDCIYDIFVIAIFILLAVIIRAYNRYKKDYERSLREITLIEEENERKAVEVLDEMSKEPAVPVSPYEGGMPAPALSEETITLKNDEDTENKENKRMKRIQNNEDVYENPDDNSDENDLDKAINGVKIRRIKEEYERKEDARKEQISLENEEKIDSQVRRKIRKKQ